MALLAAMLPLWAMGQWNSVDVSLGDYVCTFENDGDASVWTLVNNATNVWHIGGAVAKDGAYSMYISNDQGQSNSYTVTADSYTNQSYAYVNLKFDEEGDYSFEFDWRCMGEMQDYTVGSTYYRYDKDYLRVYLVPASTEVMANAVPGTGWIEVSGALDNSSEWRHFFGSKHFSAYETGTYKLVFAWIYDNDAGLQPPAAVDNVKVHMSPCSAPTNFVVTETGDTYASIAWTAGGGTDYDVYLDGEYQDYSMAEYFDFSGLRSDHYYKVEVMTVCENGEMSLPLTGYFRTACGEEMGLPYSEDWEHAGGVYGNARGVWPQCWDSTLRHSAYTAIHPAYNNTPDGHFSMRFVASADSNLMVSKALPATDNGVEVAFSAMLKNGSGPSVMQVGTMDDPTDTTTFEPMVTISTADNQWYDYGFSIPSTDGKHIAFLFYSNSLREAAIDDISVTAIPSCERPAAVWVDSVGSDVAYLRWNATWVGAYEVAYDTVDTMGGAGMVYVPVTTADTTAVIEGLTPMKTYYVWVRSDCGEEMEWRAAAPFATACAESECEMEVLLGGSAFTEYNASVDIVQNGIVMSNRTQSGTVRVCSTYPVALNFHGAELTGYNNMATVTVVNGGGDTILNTVGSNIQVGQSIGMPCPECIVPSGIRAATVLETSVELVWEAVADAQAYIIERSNHNPEVVEENSYTIDDLQSGVSYTFSIRTVCGNGDTSAARSITVQTLCADMTIPYVETFSGYVDLHAPTCWTVLQSFGSEPVYPCVQYAGPFDGQSLFFVSNGMWTMIASPVITLPGNAIEVSFDAVVHGAGSSLTAGVMTDLEDTATYVPLVDVEGETNTRYTFNTAQLDAEAQYYLAFRFFGQSNSQYGDVDNLTVRMNDGCVTPSGLHLVEADSTSLTVEWDETEAGTSLVLRYRAAGGQWSLDSDVSGYTEQIINDLLPRATYEIRVGMVCTMDTLWSAITAQTACGAMQVPYAEDMETTAIGNMLQCWDVVLAGASEPKAAASGSSHGRVLRLAADGDSSLVATSRPVPLAGDDITVNLWLSLAAQPGATGQASIQLGVMTDISNPATFVPLSTLLPDNGDWRECEFTTATLDANATYHVAILLSSDYSLTASIDDISIRQTPTCVYPWSTAVTSTTATSAVLAWDNTGSGSYEVMYGTVDDVSQGSNTNVSDTTTTLTGLQPSTLYYAWVRSVCGPDRSDWRPFEPFATACDVDPCQLTVRCMDSDNDGWNGNSALRLFQNGIERGSVTMTAGDTQDVPVDGICNSAPLVLVWHTGWADHEVSFEVYNADGNMIAQQLDVTALANDRPFDTIDTPCTHESINPEVDCLAPRDLIVGAITENGAVVSWLPGRASDRQWELTLNGTSRLVNERPYVLEGLTPRTAYTVSVATVCGEARSEAVTTEFNTLQQEGICDADNIASSLYPNPAAGTVTVEVSEPAEVSLVDLNGRTVGRWSVTTGALVIDLADTPQGPYFVRIVAEHGIAVRKLLVR